MFIKRIETAYTYIENGLHKQGTRHLTYGEYKDKKIAIDNFYKWGKIDSKRFVIWDDLSQIIINKKRKPDGKGFDVVW